MKAPLTPDEFAQVMSDIALGGDPEISHGAADDLLCQLLISLGYVDGVMAYIAMDKWCA